MPKFSIKDLLVATVIVAVGSYWVAGPFEPVFVIETRARAYLVGFALIGCGIGYPFSKAKLGAKLGCLTGIVVLVLAAFVML